MEFKILPSRSGQIQSNKQNDRIRMMTNSTFFKNGHNIFVADEAVSGEINTVSLLLHELSHAAFDHWLATSPNKFFALLAEYLPAETISKLVKLDSKGTLMSIDGDLYDLLSERYAFELQYRFDTAISNVSSNWPLSSFSYSETHAGEYLDIVNDYVRRNYDIDNPLLENLQMIPLDRLFLR